MNILVDNGSPHLRNIGDMAMLQAAVKRLRGLWPEATIHVMSADADRLKELVPGTIPVPVAGRRLFCQEGTQLAKEKKGGGRLTERLRKRWPLAAHRYMRMRLGWHGQATEEIDAFVKALKNSELIVAAGGGYINDSFRWVAYDILETLRMANRRGIPFALMGQGVGPLEGKSMRMLAGEVMSQAIVVGLREGKVGPGLMKELGVDAGKVVVTGDDALESVVDEEPAAGASLIGVNIRVADYAGVDAKLAEALRPGFAEATARLGAGLIALPVAAHDFDSDVAAIASIIGPMSPDAGESVKSVTQFIPRVARCRVVVTGSYHAGVFALGMGIPVVGLANNRYYLGKFAGLADMFGAGCRLVQLDAPEPARALGEAIVESWNLAESIGPRLRAAARRQLEAGRLAYERIYQTLHPASGHEHSHR